MFEQVPLAAFRNLVLRRSAWQEAARLLEEEKERRRKEQEPVLGMQLALEDTKETSWIDQKVTETTRGNCSEQSRFSRDIVPAVVFFHRFLECLSGTTSRVGESCR